MSEKQSTDQYGRRKWNVELYEQEAKTKKETTSSSVELSKQSIIQSETSSSEYIKHRNKLLQDSINAVKQFNLINPEVDGSKSFGANKRFGFFCPICDLSFRDNLALVDHLNSPQHVRKANEASRKSRKEGDQEESGELEGGIRRADLSEVISTMEQLVARSLRDKSESSSGGLTFMERVEKRRKFEQDKLAQRQQKRQRKRQKLQQDKQEPNEDPIASLMGFSGFSSSKK